MIDIVTTSDGAHTLYSEKYGVTYHSIHGAVQESNHVFINAGLRYVAVLKDNISILEIGLGTGLNAILTLIEGKKRNLQIHYHGIEAYPVDKATIDNLNYTSILTFSEDLDYTFEKMHEASWNEAFNLTENFNMIKTHDSFENFQPVSKYDIIYFDAFAPNAQPELWKEEIFQKMYNSLELGGILVTYCAKGEVKRTMKKVGFEVENLKGPIGKREMTRALKI